MIGARLRSRWQKIRQPLLVVVAFVAFLLLIVSIIGGYLFNWNWAGLSRKTLWDWLQLLIIPLALAVIAIFFNRSERKNEQKVALDNQQETALQEYIKEMSELLLHEKLRESQPENEVRSLARVRTLTVLPRLDGKRKASVLQFLYESNLIVRDEPIVDLNGADLSHVDSQLTNLRKAHLSRAKLKNADLWIADLSEADLSHSDLRGAYLNAATLIGTNLRNTKLGKADLSGALLIGADLRGVDLGEVDLREIDLSEADLYAVSGITIEELEKQARSLKGATMPDGSIHA